jgi:hypothetical protein
MGVDDKLTISLDTLALTDRNDRELPVRLKHARKLLLLLTIAPEHRLPRRRLAQAIWPRSRLRAAEASLRQALHELRTVLSVTGDRSEVSLPVPPDLSRAPSRRDIERLFPENASEVTAMLHLDHASPHIDPIDALYALVRFHTSQSPRRAIDLLASNVDIVCNGPSHPLPAVIRGIAASNLDPRRELWLRFFALWSTHTSHGAIVVDAVQRLVEAAERIGDPAILCRVLYWHSSNLILQGARIEAIRLLENAVTRIPAAHAALLRFTIGTAWLHEGDWGRARENMLVGLTGMREQPAEAATHSALFALYAAQRNELESYEVHRAQTERQMQGLRLERARYVLLYAELEAERVSKHWERAFELCDQLQERAGEADLRHLILYATETRAAIAHATGDTELQTSQWRAALRLRRKLGFRTSAWDDFRLREMAAAS